MFQGPSWSRFSTGGPRRLGCFSCSGLPDCVHQSMRVKMPILLSRRERSSTLSSDDPRDKTRPDGRRVPAGWERQSVVALRPEAIEEGHYPHPPLLVIFRFRGIRQSGGLGERSGSGSAQIETFCGFSGFAPVVDDELLENVRNVRLHSPCADAQMVGDLGVRESLR
jgi:hypothetical protein